MRPQSWPPPRTFEQKARFYLAVGHDLAGDHEAAATEYRTLTALSEDQLVVPPSWMPGASTFGPTWRA